MIFELDAFTRSEIKHHYIKIRWNMIEDFPPVGEEFTLTIGDSSDTVKIDKLSRIWPHSKLSKNINWQKEANTVIIKEPDGTFILKQNIPEDVEFN